MARRRLPRRRRQHTGLSKAALKRRRAAREAKARIPVYEPQFGPGGPEDASFQGRVAPRQVQTKPPEPSGGGRRAPITKEQVVPVQEAQPTENLLQQYNDSQAAQDFGLSVTFDEETGEYVEDVSAFGFEGDQATKRYSPEEFQKKMGGGSEAAVEEAVQETVQESEQQGGQPTSLLEPITETVSQQQPIPRVEQEQPQQRGISIADRQIQPEQEGGGIRRPAVMPSSKELDQTFQTIHEGLNGQEVSGQQERPIAQQIEAMQLAQREAQVQAGQPQQTAISERSPQQIEVQQGAQTGPVQPMGMEQQQETQQLAQEFQQQGGLQAPSFEPQGGADLSAANQQAQTALQQPQQQQVAQAQQGAQDGQAQQMGVEQQQAALQATQAQDQFQDSGNSGMPREEGIGEDIDFGERPPGYPPNSPWPPNLPVNPGNVNTGTGDTGTGTGDTGTGTGDPDQPPSTQEMLEKYARGEAGPGDLTKAEVEELDVEAGITKEEDIQQLEPADKVVISDKVSPVEMETATAKVKQAIARGDIDPASYEAALAGELAAIDPAIGDMPREAVVDEIRTLSDQAVAARRDPAQEEEALAKVQDFDQDPRSMVDPVTGEKVIVNPTPDAEVKSRKAITNSKLKALLLKVKLLECLNRQQICRLMSVLLLYKTPKYLKQN